jgi:GrpB-like predicted nucleotidyltransferase (UPF0157 family)
VITVVDYDPRWPERFETLRHEYAVAMAAAGVPFVAIEHVGSTSVPGLAAKPIIDCDIVVREGNVAAASKVLMSLGFTPLGELGIPQRWAFKEPARLAGTNTYVVVDACLSLRNHRAVRDVLRADAALRDEYAAVKRDAGARAANPDRWVGLKCEAPGRVRLVRWRTGPRTLSANSSTGRAARIRMPSTKRRGGNTSPRCEPRPARSSPAPGCDHGL